MTGSSDSKRRAVAGEIPEAAAALRRRYMMIAEAAYFRAEKRAFIPGDEVADWLEAEAEVDAALGRENGGVDNLRICVRDLVVGGASDLPERVRLLVVRSLAAGGLDGATIKTAVLEAIKGAEDGVLQLGERGGDVFAQAVEGVEGALSDVAEAGKLTVEEARGKMAEFASDDLRKAVDDLVALKTLLDDVLHENAANAGAFAQATWSRVAGHARVQGTQLAQRIDELLMGLGDHVMTTISHRQKGGKRVVREKTGALAGMACATLRSIADRLERGIPKD